MSQTVPGSTNCPTAWKNIPQGSSVGVGAAGTGYLQYNSFGHPSGVANNGNTYNMVFCKKIIRQAHVPYNMQAYGPLQQKKMAFVKKSTITSATPSVGKRVSMKRTNVVGAIARCQSGCRNDADCDGSLICFERNGEEDVTGCTSVPNVISYQHISNSNCFSKGQSSRIFDQWYKDSGFTAVTCALWCTTAGPNCVAWGSGLVLGVPTAAACMIHVKNGLDPTSHTAVTGIQRKPTLTKIVYQNEETTGTWTDLLEVEAGVEYSVEWQLLRSGLGTVGAYASDITLTGTGTIVLNGGNNCNPDGGPTMIAAGKKCTSGDQFLGYQKTQATCRTAAVADPGCKDLYWVQQGMSSSVPTSGRCYCSTFDGSVLTTDCGGGTDGLGAIDSSYDIWQTAEDAGNEFECDFTNCQGATAMESNGAATVTGNANGLISVSAVFVGNAMKCLCDRNSPEGMCGRSDNLQFPSVPTKAALKFVLTRVADSTASAVTQATVPDRVTSSPTDFDWECRVKDNHNVAGFNYCISNMGECEGPCNQDTDCAGTLRCWHRDGKTQVPGCAIDSAGVDGVADQSYCYDPSKFVDPTLTAAIVQWEEEACVQTFPKTVAANLKCNANNKILPGGHVSMATAGTGFTQETCRAAVVADSDCQDMYWLQTGCSPGTPVTIPGIVFLGIVIVPAISLQTFTCGQCVCSTFTGTSTAGTTCNAQADSQYHMYETAEGNPEYTCYKPRHDLTNDPGGACSHGAVSGLNYMSSPCRWHRPQGAYQKNANANEGVAFFNGVVWGPNQAPSDIQFDGDTGVISVDENAVAPTVLGTLKSVDQDRSRGDTGTFTVLQSNCAIVGGTELKLVTSINYELNPLPFACTVTVTDQEALTFTKTFTFVVNNLNEAPTEIQLVQGGAPVSPSVALAASTTTTNLAKCQGPCSNDADCSGHLVCFQRAGTETVPGCLVGDGGVSGNNYCTSAIREGDTTWQASLQVSDPDNIPFPGASQPHTFILTGNGGGHIQWLGGDDTSGILAIQAPVDYEEPMTSITVSIQVTDMPTASLPSFGGLVLASGNLNIAILDVNEAPTGLKFDPTQSNYNVNMAYSKIISPHEAIVSEFCDEFSGEFRREWAITVPTISSTLPLGTRVHQNGAVGTVGAGGTATTSTVTVFSAHEVVFDLQHPLQFGEEGSLVLTITSSQLTALQSSLGSVDSKSCNPSNCAIVAGTAEFGTGTLTGSGNVYANCAKIGELTLEDVDANQLHTYELTNNAGGTFVLSSGCSIPGPGPAAVPDSRKCAILVAPGGLNYEDGVHSFVVEVVATDNGSPPLSTPPLAVTIYLRDILEAPPLDPNVVCQFEESALNAHFICQMAVTEGITTEYLLVQEGKKHPY